MPVTAREVAVLRRINDPRPLGNLPEDVYLLAYGELVSVPGSPTVGWQGEGVA